MGTTTDELGLSRPVDADDADVPQWITTLTDELEARLTAGHVSLWSPGDFKYSARTADHGRWLKCDGRELTAAEIVTALGLDSGDADAFATLLGTGTSSIYGSAATSKVQLPDGQGRGLVGAGAGAGLTSRVRGDQGGAESVTLTANQSGVRNHTHESGTHVVAAHGHAAGSLVGPDHTHTDGTLVVAAHHHTVYMNTGGAGHSESRGTAAGPYFCAIEGHVHFVGGDTLDSSPGVNGATGPASATAVAGTTATASPDVEGNSGNPNGDSSGGYDADEAHANMQPYLVPGHLFIRV